MAETLNAISVASLILGVVFLFIAVYLWFHFDIPTIFGDLTGRTAKKSIAKFREENTKSSYSGYHRPSANDNRASLTKEMQTKQKYGGYGGEQVTELLDDDSPSRVMEETTLLTAPSLEEKKTDTEIGKVREASFSDSFVILEESMLTETQEVIE